MGFRIVRNLVTNARREDKLATVRKLRLQFALQAQQYVTLLAPVIGQVVRRVFNHPDTDCAKLLRPPESHPGLAVMTRGLDL